MTYSQRVLEKVLALGKAKYPLNTPCALFLLEITPSKLSKVRNGRQDLSLNDLESFGKLLKVPPALFLP